MEGFLGRGGYWTYFTHSQGGTKWDGRRFKTKDLAVSATHKVGFKVKKS